MEIKGGYILLNPNHYILLVKHYILLIIFLHGTTISGYTMGIKFDRDPLAVEQNNYATKVVNVHFFFDLDVFGQEAELFARYFLLVARYFLLVAFSSLLVTFCSLLVIFCSKLLWNKITGNRKKMVWLLQTSATDIFLANF